MGICSDTAVFKNKEVEEERHDYSYTHIPEPVHTRVKIKLAAGN